MVFVTFFAAGGPISFSSGTRVFRAPGRGSLLLSAAKVTKNAVQTCGLKIRSRPAHAALLFCVPRGRGRSKTTRNVELTYVYPRCR